METKLTKKDEKTKYLSTFRNMFLISIVASIAVYYYNMLEKQRNEKAARCECKRALTAADEEASAMLSEGTLSEDMINRESRKAAILEKAMLDGSIEDIVIPDVLITNMVYRTKNNITVVFDANAKKKFMIAASSR